MDFPDKIYAYFSFPNISGHLRSRMWCIDPVGLGENIEYIRKDALLEWAKSVKADPMIPMNIDKVIAKIESL